MTDLKLNDYLGDFNQCLQYEKPFCQAECPFFLDVNALIEKIKQGNYNSAYKIYRNAVGFPAIVSRLCSQPCQTVCPMKEYGGSIELRMLELAMTEHANRRDPTGYNLPAKKEKIAIIGSGPAGLGALLRLATKKYEVHIYEKSNSIGGSLNQEPNAALYMEDINRQLGLEKYELHLNSGITSRDEINESGFDAVFVATGASGTDLGLLDIDETGIDYAIVDGKAAWFAGGALIGDEGIHALAGGLKMGTVIESYLKTGNLIYDRKTDPTHVVVDPEKMSYTPAVNPVDDIYIKDEAISEAKRCIECQCDFCRTYEDLTAYYDKWPLRIKDEVFATTLEGSSEVKATPAKRLISTSNLTGITKQVCPKDIDLDNLILAGRQKMHKLGKAPWAFHDFWLRDMDFANGGSASLVYGSPLSSKCDIAFFPGCQLGASIPQLIDKTYGYLLSVNESTGLMLRCCGAPALWSGNEDKHEEELDEIRSQWEKLDSPMLITACPTCAVQLRQYLPEINSISIYEYIAERKGSIPRYEGENHFSVFDPCSTRDDHDIQNAVRNIVKNMGIENAELSRQSSIPGCCSFGGQPAIANPKYVEYVTEKRVRESELPYITYCINCRDSFLKAGKDTKHVLELLFDIDDHVIPTVSERLDNRMSLKQIMLKKYWGENMAEKRNDYDFQLIIPESVLEDMDDERILTDEVYNVVEFLLRTNRKVIDPETGIHSGYRQIGHMTYWVSYKNTDDKNIYEITDVYNHRMEIEMEAVWNGVKTETEM